MFKIAMNAPIMLASTAIQDVRLALSLAATESRTGREGMVAAARLAMAMPPLQVLVPRFRRYGQEGKPRQAAVAWCRSRDGRTSRGASRRRARRPRTAPFLTGSAARALG